MSGESLIRIIEDVILEDGCTHTWQFLDEQTSVFYFCRKHQTRVPLSGPCPKSEFWARAGETVTVPSKVARRLVEAELAEFPTHTPEPDQGVTETLDRVNALMEAQGLPHMDPEAMGVWKIEGRREAYQRPARPRDRRLAGDLGLDPADIAAMRDLARGYD